MKIVFSQHVREKIIERHIQKGQIIKCAENPDLILPADKNRKSYLKDMGKNYLNIIVAEEENKLVVVTVYWIAKTRVKRYNPN